MMSTRFYSNHFFLLFLGGLAGGCAWLVHPVFVVLMWLPLLWVEKNFRENNSPQKVGRLKYYSSLFKRLYVFFFTWNTMAAFWLLAAHTGREGVGGVFALVAIPALMTMPVLLFHLLSTKPSFINRGLIFISCWLAYEFLQHRWELAWVWLTLGNSLASVHYLVQWYEYTGVLGGSLWILGASILLFNYWQQKGNRIKYALVLTIWLIAPAIFSSYLYFTYSEKGTETDIVIVQPDLDPYTEKVIEHPDYLPIYDQNLRLIELIKTKITVTTDLVLLPESANSSFPDVAAVTDKDYWPAEFNQLIDSLKDFSKAAILLGLNTYSLVDKSEKDEPTVIQSKNKEFFFRRYNSAIFYQKDSVNRIYHKSILVPAGEGFPFLSLSKKIFFFHDFRDITTPQKERVVFKRTDGIKFAPLICYESTFGEYVGDYIKKGATILCVMTNDAYWQGTPEPKQHLLIDRLRAIEYRRSIARASHHGHSGVINQKGDFAQLTATQVQVAIRGNLRANNIVTFYLQHGDFIGRVALFLLCIVFGARLIALDHQRVE
jgi:apolipoprotein N-acyltransferase